jgi:hypothetical protein
MKRLRDEASIISEPTDVFLSGGPGYRLANSIEVRFVDPEVGLKQEPFVEGVPEMIDDLVVNIPNARRGFRLLFSASPFPGSQRKLTRLREEFGGWWYASDRPRMEGWLCPALLRYFDEAPEEIYVKAEPMQGDHS